MSETSFWRFLRAFTAHWFTAMSGPLTVPLAIAALYVPNNWLRILFGLLAVVCAAFSAYWVWRDQRVEWLHTKRTLTEALEKPRLSFAVHGIPVYYKIGNDHFFFVPDVTITNQSPQRKASVGVSLWIAAEGNTELHCPAETRAVTQWEASQESYRNRILLFPLNLDPTFTVSGYMAFSGNLMRGGPSPVMQQDGTNPELRYVSGRLEFTDFQASPSAIIHQQELRYYIYRETQRSIG